MTDSGTKTDAAKSQPPKVDREPNAAEIYHELVHTPITGWSETKIVAHKEKCVAALAAKQKKDLDRITG